jgi:CheY-like chemotaxis protein
VNDDVLKRATILVVDDQEPNVLLVEAILQRAGYSNVVSTTDPREGLRLYREATPDLLVLDLHMPELNGFEIIERITTETPEGVFVPILVLTADATPQAMHRALAMGARDFLRKPFDALEVLLRIRNLLETRLLHVRLQDHNALLEEEIRKRTAELTTNLEKVTAMADHRRALLARTTRNEART